MALDIKIQAFARAMNGQLEANTARGGWRGRSIAASIVEIRLLLDALEKKVYDESRAGAEETLDERRIEIANLAADLANNAMFIAENCNALRYDGLPTE